MAGFGFLFFIGIMLSVVSLTIPRPSMQGPPKSLLINAQKGVVSTENKLCSDIGVDILKQGGTAVDSAIAATLCIGTVNMYSSGLGGGGFALVRNKKGQTKAYDFRETAPHHAYRDMYNENPVLAQISGLSVAVPGELKGLEKMHQIYGRLPWKQLFLPAIQLAMEGWEVNAILAARIQSGSHVILKDEVLKSVFTKDGQLLVQGDWIKRINYGKTLQLIAEKGADVFYKVYNNLF
jgi:gamma-glutamyltranspeptidase